MAAEPRPFEDVTAAILAGGAGQRVGGRDKGMMPLAGRPLVAWMRDRISAQAGTIVICANRHCEEYARHGSVVADRASGYRGPLAGIDAALAVCATPWLLTVPVDSPRVPRDLAARLRDAATAEGTAAAAARVGGRREPLFAIYRREVRDTLEDALRRDLGVWRWQDELGVAVVDFSDVAADFANLNTPAEFDAWENAIGTDN